MTKARDIASASPAPSTVSATELGYLDGVTSNIQTQIDSKTGGVATDTPPASPTEGQVWLDTDGTTADANYVLKSTLSSTGDIFYASSANNPARLGIGSSSQVLTVSGGVPTWATPAAGGAYTLINSGGTTLTGASVTISLSGTYTDLYVIVRNFKPTTQDRSLFMRFNADSNTRYKNINVDYNYTARPLDENYLRVTSRQSNSVADGLAVVHIPDYQNTTTWKIIHSYAFGNYYSPTTEAGIGWNISAYNQTGAITSLVFHEESGSNLNGGTVFVYGVK